MEARHQVGPPAAVVLPKARRRGIVEDSGSRIQRLVHHVEVRVPEGLLEAARPAVVLREARGVALRIRRARRVETLCAKCGGGDDRRVCGERERMS